MEPLEKALRNQLEMTIKTVRGIAEKAAQAAIQQLGVEQAAPYPYLTDDEKSLRRQLRAHGRQLGDVRDVATKQQEIERLTEEVAYEHWHRMLFARFLAENGLLIYFDSEDSISGVPVTLEDCKELAEELGYRDGWDLAARMAARMLPQIFRPHSPVFKLTLPPERQQELEKLLTDLPEQVFSASDSLGWVYQFWQAKKKEDINDSEVKIGARELPVVTQLFTEPYMVSFLLDNSLGAWWAAQRLTTQDLQMATSEVDLRKKASLPDVPLEYLRFLKDKEGTWASASGAFEKWPQQLSEFKVLDPCCGSGHFLVAAFLMIVPMRMELEGLTAQDACNAVLQDNLHGLEIDKRCVELAAFALALTAWRYPGAGGYRKLADIRVACSGLAINAKKEEWLKSADGNINLQTALEVIYDQFANAPVLGSLLNPKLDLNKSNLFTPEWADVAPLLNKAFSGEEDAEMTEMGVAAYGMAAAANILGGKYHWVITNVPYLSRSKQGDVLRKFCEENYPEAKNDLANVFLDRCLDFCEHGVGTVSVVLPQNWLFLGSYKNFREKLLINDTWHMICKLGAKAFQTPMWDFNVQLLTISRGNPLHNNAQLGGIDAAQPHDTVAKAIILREGEVKQVEQARQLENPDARVTLEHSNSNLQILASAAECYQGLRTGDSERFIHYYWEIDRIGGDWELYRNSSKGVSDFEGMHEIILWGEGKGQLHEYARESRSKLHDMHESGNRAWGLFGIAINLIFDSRRVRYMGEKFDGNINVIFPKYKEDFPALWSYCSSLEFSDAVRLLDQKLSVTNATLLKVPFDLAYWQQVAAEKYPNGLPKPYSDDTTQWIFHGHPALADSSLQVAVARMLGYRWPAELDETMELSDEARALIRQNGELLPFADEDGIVCIPAVSGEAPAADRLLNLLVTVYQGQNVNEHVATLLTQADHAGRSLESWLRDKFFTQHCKLFHNRPFIWHIWDGLPDGFSALVNYHKLDGKTMETLIYTYLGDWINRQKDGINVKIDGASDRLAAAESLKKSLELILQGEDPYDIFVRWKPLDKQPIGWEPDLSDGVRMNIRPFLTVPDVGKRGAGILRDKPNIKWEKDRGKDVASAPWYHLGPEYGGNPGDRINNHHLKLADKIQSRTQKQKGEI
ncbi:MAG: N-6 DNA methylase [Desulfitobacterium hafniense]|nr:N-6 DNA methylase [Desulfitobacterium hafniense]